MFNPFKQYFFVIYPYRHFFEGHPLYAFDDEQRGLKAEMLEVGITMMIDTLRILNGLQDKPFQLVFSNKPFTDAVELRRAEKFNGGWWYYCTTLRFIGWLCPMLFRYFPWAPKRIYAQIFAKGGV